MRTTHVLGVLSANVVFKMWSLKKYGSYRSDFKNFIISKSPISKTTVFLSLSMHIQKGNNINFPTSISSSRSILC
ncbi:hypothetical protein Glove_61g4 [Diversispora epigaea]|uniref:Uncharacterized protein n=1 Tax=Diversispora epigaea TaxID=1348612 RepID=A0A397JDS7_9GLOM|nr:hypothetical protein Glove_61g4 [Diversispora epigaea]